MDKEVEKEDDSPNNETRLTIYWIGWAFFAVTLLAVFIAGIFISMYKVNVMDTRTYDMELRHNATHPKSRNFSLTSTTSITRTQTPKVTAVVHEVTTSPEPEVPITTDVPDS